MGRIYTIEEAKVKMEKSVKYYEDRIKAWENVKRVHKKDGSDFVNLGKNFENATIVREYGTLRIKTRIGDTYEYDYINLSRNAYNGTEEVTTADEVQERIDNIISGYKKWCEIDMRGYNEIEDQINSILPYLDEINMVIEEAKETNTHYTIQGYIKEKLGII